VIDPNNAVHFLLEFLKSRTSSGITPYELKLKIVVSIMLTRNLNSSREPCSEMRLIIIIIIIRSTVIIIIIQRMWNLKCTIVPVIIRATGIVTRSLNKNLETIPGKHSIDSLEKTAILGTSHIIRKLLQCEASRLCGGDHRWFKRSIRKKCLRKESSIIIISGRILIAKPVITEIYLTL